MSPRSRSGGKGSPAAPALFKAYLKVLGEAARKASWILLELEPFKHTLMCM
jgi:hypothetical protein